MFDLWQRGWKLPIVIVGPRAKRRYPELDLVLRKISDHDYESRVIFAGYLKTERVIQLYNETACYISPSLCEGFGLTVLEAVACGAPTTCSLDIPAGDLLGRKIIRFDPENPLDISKAIEETIKDRNPPTYEQALNIARRHSWNSAARQTFNVYIESLID